MDSRLEWGPLSKQEYERSSRVANGERARIFGAAMARARQEAGLSQAALGSRVNSNQSTLSSWERGEAEPAASMVFEIEEALGVVPGSLSHLLGYVKFDVDKPSDLENAIAADPRLDSTKREILSELVKILYSLEI